MGGKPQTSAASSWRTDHRGHVVDVGGHEGMPGAAAVLAQQIRDGVLASAIGPVMVARIGTARESGTPSRGTAWGYRPEDV